MKPCSSMYYFCIVTEERHKCNQCKRACMCQKLCSLTKSRLRCLVKRFKSTPTLSINLTLLEFTLDAVWDPVDAQDVAILSDHLELFRRITPVSDDLTLSNTNTTNKSEQSPSGKPAHRHQCECTYELNSNP